MKKLKILDLFSGIGGFSFGLEKTGRFETKKFCEMNSYCRKVLKRHWPNTEIHDDIQTLTVKPRTFDVVCGGFPCQDISYAGKGAGLAGERSGLWYEMCRVIKEANPSWVIAENVSALRSRGLDEVLRSLDEIGYNAQWHCIPASAVGAPHKRDRIWILAYPNHERNNTQRHTIDGGWEKSTENGENQLLDRSGGCSETMGNSNSGSLQNIFHENSKERSREITSTGEIYSCNSSSIRPTDLADCIQQRLERYTGNEKAIWRSESDRSTSTESLCSGEHPSGWWVSEPGVGRVVNGIPNRVDRIKCLGNAIVPQIAEILGYSILDYIYKRKSPSGISV